MSPICSQRALRLLPVLALPVAGLVLGQSASAAPPSTAPDDSAPTGSLPEGYVRLVDDTGFLTVVVPDTWTTIDTAPSENEDGSPRPWIFASNADITTFQDTFASGVLYVAVPYEADAETVLTNAGLTAGCETIAVEPYGSDGAVEGTAPASTGSADVAAEAPGTFDDPVFAGFVQVGTNCGEGGGTWNMVVASPADQSFTAIVQVQVETPADQEAIDIVLASFTYAGDPIMTPGSSVPG